MSEPSEQLSPSEAGNMGEMLCPHCLEAVDPISHFCPACGGPTSMHSAIDPMGQVYTAGHAYRQATGRPTKFIVVLGVWLIFAPQLLPLILITLGMTRSLVLSNSRSGYSSFDIYDYSSGLIGILITLGMSVVYFLIIFKTTRGYVRTRRRERGLCPMCQYDLRGCIRNNQCPKCGCDLEWSEETGEETTLKS